MDNSFELIFEALHMILQWQNVLMLFIGVIVGLLVGSVPGLSPSNTCAMLLPITLAFPFETALIFIGSVYAAAQYGGSITAILINTPGESSAIATTLDGFPLTRQGKAGYAMGLSLGSSTWGGLLAGVFCILIMKPISVYALQFGTAELFLLSLLGISVIISVSEKQPIKGGLAGALGLLIAAMPAEPTLGKVRLTFGFFELYDGIPMVAAMCGFFAFPAMIELVGSELISADTEVESQIGLKSILKGCWDSTVKWPFITFLSTFIGMFIGMLPGAGVNSASLIAYSQAKTWSKNSKNFGKGAPEGVIAPEAANNAAVPAGLVPAISLGIPGGATTAVMLAAITLHGITPGPKVMQQFPVEVYALLITILTSTILMFVFGIFYTAICSKLSQVNMAYMIPAVLAICIIGTFATRRFMFDTYLFLIFGVFGCIMVANGYMYAPLVLGVVMGTIAEKNFAIAMKISGGNFGIFFDSLICKIIWVVLIVCLLLPPMLKKKKGISGPLLG